MSLLPEKAPFQSTTINCHERAKLKALALSISLVMSQSALANVEQENLEDLQVYGEQGKTDTATKLDLTIYETPQTVTSISRAQIDDFSLTTFNKLLDYTPGVTVEEVETDRTYYTARGFDIVNFQYDGIGVPFLGGLNLGQQDTAIYDKVEVVKGAAGLVTGFANPSATINFVRKRPTEDLQMSTGLTLGENEKRRIDADVSGSISDRVRGRAVVAYDESDSYLDRHSDETNVAYGILEFDLTDSTLLTVGHSYDRSQSDGVLWGALPLLYTNGNPTDYDVSTNTAPDWTFADNEINQTFVELKQELGHNWTANLVLTQNEGEYDSELFYVYGAPDQATELGLNGWASAYSREEEQKNIDLYLSGSFVLADREHQLVVGYSKSDTNLIEASYSDPVNGFPVLGSDWAEGNSPRPTFNVHDPDTQASDVDYEQESLYFSSRLNVADNLWVLIGQRKTEIEQSGISYGGASDGEAEKTVPFYGVTYEVPDENLMFYASYGEVFKQQTWVDASLQPLGATLGESREIGFKKSLNQDSAILSVAAFSTEQSNFGVFIGRNGDGIAIYEGAALESQGYEVELSGEVVRGLNIGAGYTRVDIQSRSGADARRFIPSETRKISAIYEIPAIEGLKVGGVVKWQEDITTENEAVEQSSYTLLDLAVHYQLNNNLGFGLNVENATDKKYLNSLYWDQAYYGAPREVSASVRWTY